ncbi:uncharacterized protein BO97DRAFT_420375 [Aspergillus homomorphus CBS 101889]|uniref:Uncharacterized protein n=1 Tax=Aspergillus homomorphus (strain CBS 101889) TaxID=1450537 RepID=A0A395IAD7_ASPHC|nr:hypothetical protein BO97DRAFT_420375 [Aspergillus homomorphus CBS 101889]RAL16991.1 hypothetical protein BO97DRAFT_420375 [Aspergillus homomorphus CBS 101889]
MDYPLKVADLSKRELRGLIDVLIIDSEKDAKKSDYLGQLRSPETVEEIREAIKALPPQLRRRSKLVRVMLSQLQRATAEALLCEAHEGLNAAVICNILALVKVEVTHNVRHMKWYGSFLSKEIRNLIDSAQALIGMWWERKREHDCPPKAPLRFQENRCQACMLARIVYEPWCLRDLRALLVSRVQTRGRHRVPQLLAFIDVAIDSLDDEEGFPHELSYKSSKLAFKVKDMRKDAWYVSTRYLRQKERALERERAKSENLRHRTRTRIGNYGKRFRTAGTNTDDEVRHLFDRIDKVSACFGGLPAEIGPIVRPLNVKKSAPRKEDVAPTHAPKIKESNPMKHVVSMLKELALEKPPYDSGSKDERLSPEFADLSVKTFDTDPLLAPASPSTREITPRHRTRCPEGRTPCSEGLEDMKLSSHCDTIELREQPLWSPTFVDHIVRDPYHEDLPFYSEQSLHTIRQSAAPFFRKPRVSLGVSEPL